MQTVTLARNAMATRFELVLIGVDAARLRAAGEEALAEVDRLDEVELKGGFPLGFDRRGDVAGRGDHSRLGPFDFACEQAERFTSIDLARS